MESGDSSAISSCPADNIANEHGESIPKRPRSTQETNINGDDTNDDGDVSLLYLDYNATTPMAPEVKAAIWEAMNVGWANPSSNYAYGLAARKIVDEARERVARMLNAASPEDVIFTSGGTEADNWVIQTAVEYFHQREARQKPTMENGDSASKPHVITTNFEHDAVRLPLEQLHRRGQVEVTWLPPVAGQVVSSKSRRYRRWLF